MAHVVITGANRGIGLEMARIAIDRGDQVTATARRPAESDALQSLGEKGGLVTVALDVTDEESIAAFGMAVDRPVDLAVLNAGVMNGYGSIDSGDHDLAAWRDVLLTNVAGPYLTAKALLPHLKATEKARIAIVSSKMGSSAHASGNAIAYRASKAAASNLAVNLAAALKGDGIAVGAYHPGWVRTDMGGEDADISPEESAKGLMRRFDALDLDRSGVFETYDGTRLAF